MGSTCMPAQRGMTKKDILAHVLSGLCLWMYHDVNAVGGEKDKTKMLHGGCIFKCQTTLELKTLFMIFFYYYFLFWCSRNSNMRMSFWQRKKCFIWEEKKKKPLLFFGRGRSWNNSLALSKCQAREPIPVLLLTVPPAGMQANVVWISWLDDICGNSWSLKFPNT